MLYDMIWFMSRQEDLQFDQDIARARFGDIFLNDLCRYLARLVIYGSFVFLRDNFGSHIVCRFCVASSIWLVCNVRRSQLLQMIIESAVL